jgi:hypothetical protein
MSSDTLDVPLVIWVSMERDDPGPECIEIYATVLVESLDELDTPRIVGWALRDGSARKVCITDAVVRGFVGRHYPSLLLAAQSAARLDYLGIPRLGMRKEEYHDHS